MANKKPKTKNSELVSDDLFFENELDFGEFDFDSEEVADNRDPVTKFAFATAEVVGKKLQDNLVRDSIKKSFPTGYGDALDVLDSGTSSIRTLYDTAAKELKPVKKDLQRITAKVLPKISDKLPEGIRSKLETFSKDDDGESTRRDYEEDVLQSSLNQVFAKQSAEDDLKGQLKESIDQTRFNSEIFQLDEIRKSTRVLSEYQSNIGINFHRRSLELQYRHYFTAQKTLEEIKKTFSMQETAFKIISKNTGLPEYAKLRNGERFQEHLRNRFIDNSVSTIFGKGANFIPNLLKNITDAGVNKIKDVAGGLGSATSQVSMGADMLDSGGGISGSEIGGAIAGDAAGESIIDYLNKRFIKPIVDKSPTVKKMGNQLSYLIGNAGSLANDWADENDFDYGVTGDVKDFLRQQVKGTLAGDNQLMGMEAVNLDLPAEWNNHNSKSLNEIIPGLLSRIHREIKILRTGDVGTKLIGYDVGSAKFSNDEAAVATLAKKVFNKNKVDAINYRGESIIKMIDPENTLSETDRKELISEFLQMSVNHNTASKDRLSNSSSFKTNGDKFSSIFSQFFEDDELGTKKTELAANVRNMSRGIDLDHREIQAYVNAGYGAQLEQLGIIKKGKIDYKEYALRLMNGSLPVFDETISDGEINSGLNVPANKQTVKHKHVSNKVSNNKHINNKVVNNNTSSSNTSSTNNINNVSNHNTNHSNVTNVNFDIEPLLQKLESNNVKPEVIDIGACLKRIEELLNNGLTVNGSGNNNQSSTESGEQSGRWRDWRLGDAISNLLQFSGGKVTSGIQKVTQGMAWSGGKVISGMKQLGGWVNNKIPDIEEVWIPGKDKAILLYSKLKDGSYISSIDPNLVIYNLKTLKKAIQLGGQILDKSKLDDNGQPTAICDVDELINAVMVKKGKIVAKLSSLIGKGFGLLKNGILNGLNLSQKALSVAKMMGKGVGYLVREVVNGPQDVYVKGEDSPRLFATLMRLGVYISKTSNKVIERPTDIDGEVLHEGNVIISFDDIKKGLYTARGRKVLIGKGLLGRLATRTGEVIGGTLRALKNGAKKVGQFLSDGFSYTKDFLKSVFGEGIIITSKKTISVLEEIRDLLDARLPNRKKVFGDKDGDGIRDNSVDDLAKKDAEADKAKAASGVGNTGMAKKAGLIGSLKAGWEKYKSKEREEEEVAEEEDGSLLEDAANLAEIGDFANGDGGNDSDGKEKRGKRRGKKPGRFKRGLNKTGRGLKGLGGKLGRGLSSSAKGLGGLVRNIPGGKAGGALALATGGLAAYSIASDDALANSEKNVAYSDVSGAMAGGLGGMAAGAAVGSVVPIVGTVIGGLVGGIAGGLLGSGIGSTLGGLMFNKSLGELAKLRYVQYGFTPDDKRYTQPIYELEQMMEESMIKGPTGVAFDPSKINPNDMMKLFGRKIGDAKGANAWAMWMLQRFKPVYLAHANALAKIKPGVKLSAVDDKLTATEKHQFINAITISDAIYTVMMSPVPELSQLTVGPSLVIQYLTALKTKLKVEADKEKKTDGVKALAIPATAAVASVESLDVDKPKLDKDGKPVPNTDANKDKIKLDQPGSVSGAVAVGAVITASGNFETNEVKGTLSELENIFMKTVGLTELDAVKITNIRKLIKAVLPKTTLQNKIASYNGNVNEIFKIMSSDFGCDFTDALHFEFFNKWMLNRFIPTYLNLVTSLVQSTGNLKAVLDLTTVKRDAALSAAIVVAGTVTAKSIGGVPVWTINTSPWPDYVLNSKMASVEGSLNTLKNSLGTSTLKDVANDLNKKKPGTVMDSVSKMLGDIGNKVKGAYNTTKEVVGNAVDNVQKTAADAWKGTKNAASNAYTGAKQVANDVVGGIGQSANTVMETAAKVFSGPMKTRPGYKALLTESDAQKLSAVEKAVLFGNIAEESGFNPRSENLNYSSVQRLRAIFPNRLKKFSDAQLQGLVNNPQGLGDAAYPELGGYKYRGRGFIQLTGLDNYRTYSKELFGDDRLVQNPDLANEPGTASKIAIAYMRKRANPLARNKYGKELASLPIDQAADVMTKAVAGTPTGTPKKLAYSKDFFKDFSAGTESVPTAGGAPIVTAKAPSDDDKGKSNVPTTTPDKPSTGSSTVAGVVAKAPVSVSSGNVVPVNFTPPAPSANNVSFAQSKAFADTSIKTQQAVVKEESAKSFANVENLLAKALTEHVNQTALLRQVVALLSSKGNVDTMVKEPDSKSMNTPNKPIRQTSDLPRNPVSVAKAM